MNPLIPRFIQTQYKNKKYFGGQNAVVLFADISGFTPLTEKFMTFGKEGAEILSGILDEIFIPLINAVYENHGFITGFAGDAFTALFPKDKALNALNASIKIREYFNKNGVKNTKWGDFSFGVKQGLTAGKIEWLTAGNSEIQTYAFKGEGMYNAPKSEKKADPGEIIFDDSILELIQNRAEFENKSENYYILKTLKEKIKIKKQKPEKINEEILRKFVPDEILNVKFSEFRKIVSIFIAFKDFPNLNQCRNFIQTALNLLIQYGGSLNSVDFGDKGANMLIFFGAPVGREKIIEKSVNFIYALKEEYPDIKAGINYGMVFSGISGNENRSHYHCLGDVINVSARIMTSCEEGEIRISSKINEKINTLFETENLGKFKFKGKSEEKEICLLKEKRKKENQFTFTGRIIGRKKILNSIREKSRDLISSGKFRGIISLFGEAGIGKSRILYEFYSEIEDEFTILLMKSDEIIKESLNPAAYALKDFFQIEDNLSEDENKILFEKKFSHLIESLNKKNETDITSNLIKLKSFLGSILNIFWKDSLYEKSEPEMRFNNVLFVLKEFLKGLSLIKPLIIMVEDLHWLDDDTKKFFSNFCLNIEDYPVMILTTSRYSDDGSKPELGISDDTEQEEFDLNHFDYAETVEMIESILEEESADEVYKFVFEKTEGNPFFTEQYTAFLKENSFISFSGEKYILSGQHTDLPDDINSLLTARIDRLPIELKELTLIASVLGKEFESEIILEMLRIMFDLNKALTSIIPKEQRADIFGFLDKYGDFSSLLEMGEKESLWQTISSVKYMFRHALLKDTAYEMQSRLRLRNLHRFAAEAVHYFVSESRPRYKELAYHYETAEVKSKAAFYLEKAADYSKERYENIEAADLYIRLKKQISDPEKLLETDINIGDMYEIIGKWTECEVLYNNVIDESEKIGNLSLISVGMGRLAKLILKKGETERAFKLINKSYEISIEIGDKKQEMLCLGVLGQYYWRTGSYTEAEEKFRKRLQLAEELNDPNIAASTLSNIGNCNFKSGNLDEALEYYNRALEIAERNNYKTGIHQAVGNIGIIYRNKRKYDKALECYKKKLEIAEETHSMREIGRALGNIGLVYWNLGKYEKAMKYYKSKMKISRELGDMRETAIAAGNIGLVYHDRRDYAKAEENFKLQMDIAKRINDKTCLANAASCLGNLYIDLMEYDKASEFLSLKLDLVKYKGKTRELSNLYLLFSTLKTASGDYEEALEYAEQGLEIAVQIDELYLKTAFLYYKALCFYKMKSYKEALEMIEQSIETSKHLRVDSEKYLLRSLEIKIRYYDDKEKTAESFLELLDEIRGERHNEAEIYYELYCITGSEDYRLKGIEIFKELDSKNPLPSYKERLNELKSE